MALSGLGLVDATSGDYDQAEQLLAEARDLSGARETGGG